MTDRDRTRRGIGRAGNDGGLRIPVALGIEFLADEGKSGFHILLAEWRRATDQRPILSGGPGVELRESSRIRGRHSPAP